MMMGKPERDYAKIAKASAAADRKAREGAKQQSGTYAGRHRANG